MPGLLQRFEVATDEIKALEIAVQLPFFWNKKGASHFKTGLIEGASFIDLYGYESNGAQPLPYPLTTPEAMYEFLKGWISHAQYGYETDTDGSVSRGWAINQGHDFSTILRLKAEWIVYGK